MLGHGHDLEIKLSESEAQAQLSVCQCLEQKYFPSQRVSMFEASGISPDLFGGSWYLEFLYHCVESLGWKSK